MLDEAAPGDSTPAPRCNWCSAELPSDHEAVCPSCGATLLGEGDTSVPGLTAIDAEAILRNARAAKAKPRSRLLGWISGDYDADAEAGTARAAPGSLAPPPADVRREMLRLELEAQVANAQAEVESMAADEAIEQGRSLEPRPASDAADTAEDEPASESEPADGHAAPEAASETAGDDAGADSDEAPPA
jgi:hypothetical protein